MTEKTIGKYKVLREIGVGGMGIVYKGIDPSDQKAVAIKVLPPSNTDRATVQRFTREAQAMSQMNHPNLVRVYEHGMTQGQNYYVMEFVEGESLKGYIKNRGPMKEKDTAGIVIQACRALSYTHRQGIIHRDIKPANIMLTIDGKVKVMDFGLVQIPGLTKVTQEGSAVGTAEYMSPEQIDGGEIDTRSDIYSLGITMYEMLTGRVPFKGDNVQTVLLKQKEEEPRPPSEIMPIVSAEMEKIVLKALAKDVARRYQKIDELMEELQSLFNMGAAMQEDPGFQKPEGQSPAARSSAQAVKPFPLVPAAVVAVVLLLLAAGIKQKDRLGEMVSFLREKAGAVSYRDIQLKSEAQQYLADLENAEKHQDLARRYERQGMIDAAVTEYEKALSYRTDHPPTYRDLALLLEQKNEKKKAVKAWGDLLKYVQSGPLVDEAKRHLRELMSE